MAENTMSICPCPHCGCGLNDRRSEFDVQPHSPRILSLMNSNERPLDVEHYQLAEVLREAEAQQHELDQRLSQLLAAAKRLTKMRDEKKAMICQYQGVLSSIRRVPEDVWRQIFESSHPALENESEFDDPFYFRYNTMASFYCPPTTFIQVSSSWRAISLSHPKLWSLLIVTDFGGGRNAWNKLYLQIQRSGEYLLDVVLKAQYMTTNLGNPVFSLLLSTSRRWRTLTISAYPETIKILDGLPGGLPSLRTTFAHSWQSSSQGLGQPLKFLTSAPGLTEVITRASIGPREKLCLPSSVRKWRNFGPLEMSQILATLDASPSITHLGLFAENHGDPVHSGTTSILHTSLTSLRLSVSSIGLLTRLRAPGLEDFAVYGSTIPFDVVATFLHNSSCTITSLILSLTSGLAGDLERVAAGVAEVLRKAPRLHSFLFVHTQAAGVGLVAEFLCKHGTDGVITLVPQLAEVHLISGEPISRDLVLSVLEARPEIQLTLNGSEVHRVSVVV